MRTEAVFLATSNRGKVLEVKEILGIILPKLHVYSLQDYPKLEKPIDECGTSYHENAYIKAKAYLDNPGHWPTIADDSGLEVAAFPGLLGLHSARWCENPQLTKCEALHAKLQNATDRSLVFHTTFCYLEPDTKPQFFDHDLRGRAADVLAGGDGFDYDPIFVPEGFDLTYAQLGQDVKNRISQRRRALEALAAYISGGE